MTDVPPRQRLFQANFQANLIAGLLTVTPLIAVWLVFDFFLTTLSAWGHPLAVELTLFLDTHYPALQPWLDNDSVRYAIGVVVALLALYAIGALTTRVLGQQLILILENIITRIPGVQTIYSATKKLVDALRQKPGDHNQRVVLIDFPSNGLKALGFVMRTFPDARRAKSLRRSMSPPRRTPHLGIFKSSQLPA